MPRRLWTALVAGSVLLFAAVPALADPPVPKAAASVLNRIKAADTNLLAVSEEDGRFLRFLVVSSGAKRVSGPSLANAPRTPSFQPSGKSGSRSP